MKQEYVNIILVKNGSLIENRLYAGPEAKNNAATFFIETILAWNDSYNSNALDQILDDGYYKFEDNELYYSEPEVK